jgi:purine-nucleoside phosphorylase
MSTVLETLALKDLGVRVLAMSCITNAAAGIKGAILDHAHVQAVADQGAERIEKILLGWVSRVFGS